MKKLNLLLSIFIGISILSCSSDDNPLPIDSEINITKWINKQYTFYDNNLGFVENGILTDSVEFMINNNKIITFSGLSDINNVAKTISGNITYSNDRISLLQRFKDNQLVLNTDYLYDNSGELIEFRNKYWDSYNQVFEYYKSEFTHTADTIFSNNYNSIDGIQYNLQSTSKTVLDNNLNRIYYENTYNGSTGTIIATYDSSNNMITNNIYVNTIYNYTYSSIINTESIIYNNTFGKKVNMLTFGEGLAFSAKIISTNTMESVSTGSSANTFEFIIENEKNEDNYSIKTLYKEIVNDIPRDQEISEFEF
jgi:hypothetical protein